MKLILFDIDGTLVETGGTGMRAFSEALREFYGIEQGLRRVSLDGKTDPIILREALHGQGIFEEPTKEQLKRFVARYVDLLKVELFENTHSYQVLPKVRELLSVLKETPDTVLGLATGNVEEGAVEKLKPGDLNRFFVCGGFGSDSENRTELVQAAIRRAETLTGKGFHRVIVAGDTPNDIIHGRNAGTETIGVATGRYNKDQLSEHQPDLLLDSFDPIEKVLDFVLMDQPGNNLLDRREKGLRPR